MLGLEKHNAHEKRYIYYLDLALQCKQMRYYSVHKLKITFEKIAFFRWNFPPATEYIYKACYIRLN